MSYRQEIIGDTFYWRALYTALYGDSQDSQQDTFILV